MGTLRQTWIRLTGLISWRNPNRQALLMSKFAATEEALHMICCALLRIPNIQSFAKSICIMLLMKQDTHAFFASVHWLWGRSRTSRSCRYRLSPRSRYYRWRNTYLSDSENMSFSLLYTMQSNEV